MASRGSILKLYKLLLREAQKFPLYNFRMYALRRTRDAFRDKKILTRSEDIKNAVQYGEENLEVMKRQIVICQFYEKEKLVIEKPCKPKPKPKCG